MKIHISGPQGCGKSRVAREIEARLYDLGFAVKVVDEDVEYGGRPMKNAPLVEVTTEQTK